MTGCLLQPANLNEVNQTSTSVHGPQWPHKILIYKHRLLIIHPCYKLVSVTHSVSDMENKKRKGRGEKARFKKRKALEVDATKCAKLMDIFPVCS